MREFEDAMTSDAVITGCAFTMTSAVLEDDVSSHRGSSSCLTNMSIRHVGITDCRKFWCSNLDLSLLTQPPYKISWKSVQAFWFSPEDGDRMFLRKSCICVPTSPHGVSTRKTMHFVWPLKDDSTISTKRRDSRTEQVHKFVCDRAERTAKNCFLSGNPCLLSHDRCWGD
jgi:hypothetical protein